MAAASPVPTLVLSAGAGSGLDAAPNPALTTLLGVSGCPGWQSLAALLPDAAAGLRPKIDALLAGRIAQAEPEFVLPTGGAAMSLALSPLRGVDGGIAGILGVARPRLQASLDGGRELGRLLELSPMGVIRYRLDGDMVDCNDACLDMLGLDREALGAGLSWRALTPPEWRAADERGLAQLRAHGEMALFEKAFYHRDGHQAPVLIGAGSLQADHTTGFAVVIDISDAKSAERALAAGEARFRAITNAVPQMVWSARADGFLDYYNDQWYRFTGAPRGWVPVPTSTSRS